MISCPASRTHTGVAVFTVLDQNRDAACSVLALVLPAADEPDVAVWPPPGLMDGLQHRAVTPVGIGSIFAGGAVLARITVTLVDVYLTVYTCTRKH